MSRTVNLIGAGKVGRTILRLLAESRQFQVQNVASRRDESAREAVGDIGVGVACSVEDMRPADIWLLTVPDVQIRRVSEQIAELSQGPALAVHCSGYHRADVMMPLGLAGCRLASAHPVLSFADPVVAARRFQGTPVGLEGDPEAVSEVERLFNALGGKCFRISSDGKTLYHAAAVITNNFTTVLQALALEAWEEAGVPADMARELNTTLLRSTLENLERFGPAEALTGPAARGDAAVVAAQGERVAEWRDEAGQLYELLSRMAVRLKESGKALSPQEPRPRQ